MGFNGIYLSQMGVEQRISEELKAFKYISMFASLNIHYAITYTLLGISIGKIMLEQWLIGNPYFSTDPYMGMIWECKLSCCTHLIRDSYSDNKPIGMGRLVKFMVSTIVPEHRQFLIDRSVFQTPTNGSICGNLRVTVLLWVCNYPLFIYLGLIS